MIKRNGGAGNKTPTGFQQKSQAGQTGALAQTKWAESGSGQFCSLCGAWKGALGLEPTIELYLDHLVEICREVKRVMRKDACFFLNIGDSYVSGKSRYSSKSQTISGKDRGDVFAGKPDQYYHPTLKDKDLALIPFRLAIRLQDAGWWVRSVIIWNKPNPMPESVTDRCTESHEYILHLTKSAKYYWDAEAVRTPQALSSLERAKYPVNAFGTSESGVPLSKSNVSTHKMVDVNQMGANLKSVWTFPTQGYPKAHFATYPEELVRRCVMAATPAEKIGSIVLDPFAGSGTTLAVAKRLGRRAVGYELSEEYCKLAVRRIEAETAPMRLE